MALLPALQGSQEPVQARMSELLPQLAQGPDWTLIAQKEEDKVVCRDGRVYPRRYDRLQAPRTSQRALHHCNTSIRSAQCALTPTHIAGKRHAEDCKQCDFGLCCRLVANPGDRLLTERELPHGMPFYMGCTIQAIVEEKRYGPMRYFRIKCEVPKPSIMPLFRTSVSVMNPACQQCGCYKLIWTAWA